MSGPARLPFAVERQALVHLWWHDTISVVCARPSDLEDHPDLPLRIRGALGPALAAMGPVIAWRPDPFARPGAFDVLFGPKPDALPPPYVIDVDVAGDKVHVRLRLFGEAGFFVEQCRAALIQALASGIGLASKTGAMRVPLVPIASAVDRGLPKEPPAIGRDLVLSFRTPVVVRSGAALVSRPADILFASVMRVRNLAPWFAIDPRDDWRHLRELCEAASIVEDSLVPTGLRRFSRRAPGKPIPMTMVSGRLRFRGSLNPLLPYVWLAGLNHLGSHAALGFGRVDVSIYPE